MNNPDFVYTTYIQTTPEKLWSAITNPEFSRQYWVPGIVSDWKKGSKWQHVPEDSKQPVMLAGEVLESDPPKYLALTWGDPANPTDDSKVTFTIDVVEDLVRLIVVHGSFKPDSKIAGRVATGWPRVLSSLKSLLETGTALNTWAGHQNSCATPSTIGKAA